MNEQVQYTSKNFVRINSDIEELTLNMNSKNKNYDEDDEDKGVNKDLELELRKDLSKIETKMFEIDD